MLRKLMEPRWNGDIRDWSCHYRTKHEEAGEETDKVILLGREHPYPNRQVNHNSPDRGNETGTYTSPLVLRLGMSSEVYVIFD